MPGETSTPEMRDKTDPVHLEDAGMEAAAQLAPLTSLEEHEVGILQSFVKYPWASAWSAYAAFTIILLSFDAQAGSSVLGIPQFRRDFGYMYEGEYVLPAAWQSAFNGAPVAMQVSPSRVKALNYLRLTGPSQGRLLLAIHGSPCRQNWS